ncbi:MAG: 2-C-methyl-D-erythritol 2,4-cyclodiphosphate synthase [Rickettsiales bacterium]|nr:2-C-methyl-D-erythritol 2,4-cyclodiphosphate synthase [Rickettsiales bacterium]
MINMYTNRSKKYKIAALIVAAGVGNRCSDAIPKQYIKLAGKPVLFHTIRKLLANQYIDYVRVVINEDHEDFYRKVIDFLRNRHLNEKSAEHLFQRATLESRRKEEWIPVSRTGMTEGVGTKLLSPIYGEENRQIHSSMSFQRVKQELIREENMDPSSHATWMTEGVGTKLLSPIYGGASRQNSVKLGLKSLRKINPDFVVIHDACRPFVSNALMDNLVQSMIDGQHAGVVPAIEVEDTVSLANDNFIESTISREKLRAIQTPQIFNFKELLLCHQSTKEFTDDSSLVVEHKKYVAIIKGEKSNFKLTTKEDIDMAKLLLEEPKYRVGTGYDIHKFVKAQNKAENFIKICGIEIEHNMAIEAHSDGDVAIHAVVDAILGALGYGDIGEHFPPSSAEWKGCDSSYFLSFAITKAKEKGYRVSNLDITIVCEEPKISPYKAEMKKSISRTLEIDSEFVNIKATTAEKLGSIGRSEGIAAHASVLLYKRHALGIIK